MQDSKRAIEACSLRQLSLFRDLKDCLEAERHFLTRREVDSLWELFESKMQILRALEACGTELRSLLRSSVGILEEQETPTFNSRDRLQDTLRATARVREEIRQRAKENMNFIRDCLSFLDQLAASLAGVGRTHVSYGRSGRRADIGGPLIVRREV